MSEQRPPYQATAVTSSEQEHRVPVSFLEIAPPQRDTVLLLVAFRAPWDEGSPCMHLVHDKRGRLGFCNQDADYNCVGCGRALCHHHRSQRRLPICDHEGTGALPLCEACGLLSRQDIEAVRALRLEMNREP